jgi:predicted kinase
MKQKVLKKPTLVLMAGLPGAGKTTLAFKLGQKLGWAVLERDLIKESLLKGKIDEDTAGRAAYDCSLKITENFLVDQQLSVILDTSLLYPFILERAKQLVARSGAQLKIILCEVDEGTRQHRLRTRKKRISQTKGLLVPRDAAKQFERLDSSLYKKVQTKRSLKLNVEEALKYVTEQEREAGGYQSTSTRTRTPLPNFWTRLQRFVSPHTHKPPAFSRCVATQ